MINITGLWKTQGTDKNGNNMWYANLGPITLMLFVNPKNPEGHEEDKPMFNLCIKKNERNNST